MVIVTKDQDGVLGKPAYEYNTKTESAESTSVIPAVKRSCSSSSSSSSHGEEYRIVFTGRIITFEDGIETPLVPLWAIAETAMRAIDAAVSKPIGTVKYIIRRRRSLHTQPKEQADGKHLKTVKSNFGRKKGVRCLPWTIDEIDHRPENAKHEGAVSVWVGFMLRVVVGFSGGDAPGTFLILCGFINK